MVEMITSLVVISIMIPTEIIGFILVKSIFD